MAAKGWEPEETGLSEGKKQRTASACRRMLRERLTEEYDEILGAFVEAAKKGSAAHMKLATELLNRKGSAAGRQRGSATRMLRELERDEKP